MKTLVKHACVVLLSVFCLASAKADNLLLVKPHDKAAFLLDKSIQYKKYVGNDYYLVRGEEKSLRATGEITVVPNEQKLSASALGLFKNGFSGKKKFSVLLADHEPETKTQAANLSGTIVLKATEGIRADFECDWQGLGQIIRDSRVIHVQPASTYDADMDIVRAKFGDRWMANMGNYLGQGVNGEVCDIGLRVSHYDLRAIHPYLIGGSAGTSGGYHGTAVYGIIFGTGYILKDYAGIMPQAQGVYLWNAFSESDRYGYAAIAVDPSQPYPCVFQTNSWGHLQTYDYDEYATEMDDVIFRTNLVICQSQSNTGTRQSRPEAWAKNIISVGGLYHYNNLVDSDDNWSHGASIGPAADGRIKPDVCAFYDEIYTIWWDSDTSYNNFGGTSGATPIVAANVGLLHQLWAETADDNVNMFGVQVSGDTVFQRRPRAETAKALMIVGSFMYSKQADINRFNQGWGRPNIKEIWRRAPLMKVVNGDVNLKQGQMYSSVYLVRGNETSLKITLAYMDPYAVPYSSKQLINDLDLAVISPSGKVYYGNQGLVAGNESIEGGGPDSTNNVENVFVSNPEPGEWKVQVFARSINEDAVPSTTDIDANFALVISAVPCLGDFNRDGEVSPSDIASFYSHFRAGEFSCDFNDDGLLNVQDIVDYYRSYKECSMSSVRSKH